MRARPVRTLLALVVGTALVGAACTSDSEGARDGEPAPVVSPNLQLAVALEPFDSCDALLDHLKEEALARVTAYGLPGDRYGTLEGDVMFEEVGVAIAEDEAQSTSGGERSAPPTTIAPSSEAPATDAGLPTTGGGEDGQTYSGTNVVEAGVDEPDIVKTDGRRLFTLIGNTLYAFTVDGDAPNQVGSLELDVAGGSADSLLLAGDDLLVLGNVYGGGPVPVGAPDIYPYPGEAGGATLTKVDVSDPTAMEVGPTTVVDGSTVNARMVGTTARVVIETPPPPFEFVYPSRPGSPRSEQVAEDANKELIEESTLEDWLPSYVVDADGERDDARSLLDCAQVSHPKEFAGFGTITVFTVPLDGEIDPANAVGVTAAGDQVYASSEHLYVSTTRWPEPDARDDGDDEAEDPDAENPDAEDPDAEDEEIAPDTTVVPGTTPGTEPKETTTTTAPADPTETDVRTAIHRFAIPADGPAAYEASGEVVGELMHDFSMSEYDGDLRVATTANWTTVATRRGIPQEPESFVTVLRESDGELAQIGQVGGLGEGEQIRSVRFIDEVGYVVTFRQTDPLYTIDLSNPEAPEVVGELKILGYSAYLHPVDDGLLLGVGQDATARGRTLGTQVALYDVSDAANPTELQKVTLPYGDSLVESDYHAFLWWDPTSLAMVPVEFYGGGCIEPELTFEEDVIGPGAPCEYQPPFAGAIGYTVTADGITELAKVAQPAEGTPGVVCPPNARCVFEEPTTVSPPTTVPCPPEADCSVPEPEPFPTVYPSPILRSVVVDDQVLTISSSGIRSSALDTLAPIAWAPFDEA